MPPFVIRLAHLFGLVRRFTRPSSSRCRIRSPPSTGDAAAAVARSLLADDPGVGKTIMAGLFIKELIARGDPQRCFVV